MKGVAQKNGSTVYIKLTKPLENIECSYDKSILKQQDPQMKIFISDNLESLKVVGRDGDYHKRYILQYTIPDSEKKDRHVYWCGTTINYDHHVLVTLVYSESGNCKLVIVYIRNRDGSVITIFVNSMYSGLITLIKFFYFCSQWRRFSAFYW